MPSTLDAHAMGTKLRAGEIQSADLTIGSSASHRPVLPYALIMVNLFTTAHSFPEFSESVPIHFSG